MSLLSQTAHCISPFKILLCGNQKLFCSLALLPDTPRFSSVSPNFFKEKGEKHLGSFCFSKLLDCCVLISRKIFLSDQPASMIMLVNL